MTNTNISLKYCQSVVIWPVATLQQNMATDQKKIQAVAKIISTSCFAIRPVPVQPSDPIDLKEMYGWPPLMLSYKKTPAII